MFCISRFVQQNCVVALLVAGLAPAQAPPAALSPDQQAAAANYSAMRNRVSQGDMTVDFRAFRIAGALSAGTHASALEVGERTTFGKLVASGDYQGALKSANQAVDRNYASAVAHFDAMSACQLLHLDDEAARHKRLLDVLLNSVAEGADGKTSETAYFTVTTQEEYVFTNVRLGLKTISQSLTNANGHAYDRLMVLDPKTHRTGYVWFNTDLDMGLYTPAGQNPKRIADALSAPIDAANARLYGPHRTDDSTTAAAAQLPDEVKERLDHARSLMARRHYDEAIGEVKRALKMANGQCAQCYIELVQAYRQVGAHKNALEAAGKLLEIASDDRMRSTAHNAMGVAIMAMADAKKANHADGEREFRAALQLNPDNLTAIFNLGVELLKQNRDADGVATLKQYLEHAPNRANSKDAQAMIDNPRRARESFAPEFSLVTKDGEYVSNDDVKGKVVLLDFWASWCKPCETSLPTLQRLSKKYGKRQFLLISISGDRSEQAWQMFLDRHHMDWPQVLDKDQKVHSLFKIVPIPTYIVIDSEGIMRSRVIGGNFDEQLEEEVKKNLKRAESIEKVGPS